MAHLVTFALLLLPLYAPSATAFTYWVDGSCTSRPEFNVAMNEARLMARHGFLKLKSDSDTDYHNVFQQTFQTPRSDNTKYDVKNNQFDEFSFNDTPQRLLLYILGGIGWHWTPTDDRLSSDTRFYCNNGQRWNKDQTRGDFTDSDNMLRIESPCITDEDLAFTSKGRMAIDVNNQKQQNERRSTIDLCDEAFKNLGTPRKLEDSPKTNNLEQNSMGIRLFRDLISVSILHEMTHQWPYGLDDVGGEDAYGWTKIVEKTTKDSLTNAENYAYFGLWAAMAFQQREENGRIRQGGYTLPRDSEYPDLQAQDSAKRDAAAKQKRDDVVAGKLKWYDNLTKRSLALYGRIGKAFVA